LLFIGFCKIHCSTMLCQVPDFLNPFDAEKKHFFPQH